MKIQDLTMSNRQMLVVLEEKGNCQGGMLAARDYAIRGIVEWLRELGVDDGLETKRTRLINELAGELEALLEPISVSTQTPKYPP